MSSQFPEQAGNPQQTTPHCGQPQHVPCSQSNDDAGFPHEVPQWEAPNSWQQSFPPQDSPTGAPLPSSYPPEMAHTLPQTGQPYQFNAGPSPLPPNPPQASPISKNYAGIASLILGSVGAVAMFILVIYAAALSAQGKGEQDFEVTMVGIGIISDALLLVMGMTLGVVGLFMTARERITATIGLIVNVFPFLAAIVLLVVGLYMKHP